MNMQQQMMMAAATGGGVNPLGGMNPLDMFASCSGPANDPLAELKEIGAGEARALGAKSNKKHYLRICFHSASKLATDRFGNCDPYVHVTMGGGTQELSFQSITMKKSTSPVWEDVWETQIEIGVHMNCMIRVYHESFGVDTLLGVTSLIIPQAEAAVKRETLKLAGVPTVGFFSRTKPASTITVLYQVTNTLKHALDLVQIGDMDDIDLQPKDLNVSIDLRRFRMKKYAKKEDRLVMVVGLVDIQKAALAEEAKAEAQDDDDGDESVAAGAGAQVRASPEIIIKTAEREAGWDDGGVDGWEVNWAQTMNRADMLQHVISFTLQELQPDGSKFVRGVWEEPFSSLVDTVSQSGAPLHCWIQLKDAIGVNAGKALIELDIFESERHKLPPIASVEDLQIRAGAPPLGDREKPVEYFVHLYGDFFPQIDKPGMFSSAPGPLDPQWGCDPFVRISMDGPKVISKPFQCQRRRVIWGDAVRIRTKIGNTRAKIELLDGDASLFGGDEKLLGEMTIYNLKPGVNNWLHFEGGALHATNEDISLAMIKGGSVGPASTYRGSLCVHFSTKAKASANLWPPHLPRLRSYAKAQLVVKMYRGLYLTEFAPEQGEPPRKCKILIHVPSGGLPVRMTQKELDKLPKYTRQQDPNLNPIKPLNPNILCFPGEIEEGGMLNFLVGDEERRLARQRRTCLGLCGPSNPEEYDEEDDPTRPLFYVERRSPPFYLLPGVDKCYMYLFLDDELDQLNRETDNPAANPPKVFGLMNLMDPSSDPLKVQAATMGSEQRTSVAGQTVELTAHEKWQLREVERDKVRLQQERARPKWERLRWDMSVLTPPDTAIYETGVVGRLLCSAKLDEDIDKDAMDEIEDLEEEDLVKAKNGSNDNGHAKQGTAIAPVDIELLDPTAEKAAGGAEGSTEGHLPRHTVRSKKRKPDRIEMLPKTLMPTGNRFCGPALKEIPVGSFGSEVSYKRKMLSDMYTVYCHVDVLCGRDLPAMDENGLCDPTWIVQVQNKEAVSIKVPQSLNPTYVQRVVIPYEVYIPPSYSASGEGYRKRVGNVNGHLQLEPDPNNPLPPVRLIIRDRDEGFLLQPDTFQEVATIANLAPLNLDDESTRIWKNLPKGQTPPSSPKAGATSSSSAYIVGKNAAGVEVDNYGFEKGQLRLNEAHVPVWQRLDVQEDGKTMQQLDNAKGWKGKPMVLWSAGYSLQAGAHLMYKEWRFEPPNEVEVSGMLSSDSAAAKTLKKSMYASSLLDDDQLDVVDMMTVREIAAGEVFTFDYQQNGRAKVAGVDQWISNFFPGKNWVPVEDQERNMEPTPVFHINTGEFKYYRTTLDLLGIRRLSKEVKYGLSLRVGSFWKTPVDVELDDSELPTINFKGEAPPVLEWQELGEKVKSVMRLVATRDEDQAKNATSLPAGAGPQAAALSQDNISIASSVATDVGIDEFLGIRIVCPVYKAPIIDYLQVALRAKQNKGATATGLREENGQIVVAQDEKFALLPSLAFWLQSTIGLGDFGALSLPLQEFAAPGRFQGAWFEQVANAMENLPVQFQGLCPMKHVATDPKATIVYVDVFAEKEGNLWWDIDARMGRNIRAQSLFRVDDHTQYLNPADYFLNAPELLDDEFEKQPTLYVDRENTTPYPKGKTVVEISLRPFYDWAQGGETTAVVELYNKETPFWEKELATFKQDYNHQVPHQLGGGRTANVRKVANWTTGRLSRMMRAFGWRYKSRYHRPTQIQVVVKGKTKNLIAPPPAAEDEEESEESDNGGEDQEEERSKKERERKSKVADKSKGTKSAQAKLDRMRRTEGTSLAKTDEERKLLHQWTFMRPVGHLIHEHDRDSKILARLRMVSYMDEEPNDFHADNWEKLEENDPKLTKAVKNEVITTPRDPSLEEKRTWAQVSNNFVTIKYGLTLDKRILRAQIIWAAPQQRVIFKNPGTLLYVIKILEGENEGNYIQVVTPGFDLRFAFETSLYVRKTLLERWRTLERKIAENTKKSNQADSGTSSKAKSKKKKKQEENTDMEPNGFSLSIPVRENEFVMRLYRKFGLSIFDREQTESWYRKYLGEVFQDMFADMHLFEESKAVRIRKDGSKTDPYKERFMMNSMNMRRSLIVGETMDFVGELKGHVSLESVPQSEVDFDRGSKDFFDTIPQPLAMPLNRFWQIDTLMAHVYVLTARNLVDPAMGSGSINPYLTATAGATHIVSPKRISSAQTNPDFYESFQLPVQIPGTDCITLTVMNANTMGDSIVGQVDIDIEDRWQAVIQKNLTQLTSIKWLKDHLSDEGVDEESNEKIRPQLAPGKPFPIEFSELNHIDPDSKLRTPAGSIRYWVDLVPTEETYHEFDVGATRKGADFEIRVTVWNVKGVTIYQDDGQRNDLIVRGTLIIRSIDGSVTRHTKETDCHKFCNQDGTFNWRWKWPVVCPAASCSLVLQLMDSDALTDAEPLYDPEVVPLDHHLRLAYTNYIHHKNIENAVMGNHRTYVLFDSWPADAPKPVRVSCLPCCNKTMEPTPALLMCDVQVVPTEWAESHPCGEGRDAPHPLPEPAGRVSWQTALKDPVLLIKVLLGPQKVVMCKWLCGCTCFLLLAVAVFGLLFFLSQITGASGLGLIGPAS